jgi:hypothetical protein
MPASAFKRLVGLFSYRGGLIAQASQTVCVADRV